MALEYKLIQVFTRERARWHHQPLADAVVRVVHDRKLAARVLVFKGVEGTFENGQMTSHHVLDLSYDEPVKIEIVLPAAEAAELLPVLDEMVQDGIIAVGDLGVVTHRTGETSPLSP